MSPMVNDKNKKIKKKSSGTFRPVAHHSTLSYVLLLGNQHLDWAQGQLYNAI